MALKVGQRLRSQVSAAEIIVLRLPAAEVSLTCGGLPMVDIDSPAGTLPAPARSAEGEAVIGKRYVLADADSVETLVTRSGDGLLAVDGTALVIAQPKALPASD